jgi:hypothetical protein
MSTIVNKASIAVVGAASSLSAVIVTTGVSPSGVSLPSGDPALTFVDSDDLTGGTVLVSLPQSALVPGMLIALGSVSDGLAIQQCPPGVSRPRHTGGVAGRNDRRFNLPLLGDFQEQFMIGGIGRRPPKVRFASDSPLDASREMLRFFLERSEASA